MRSSPARIPRFRWISSAPLMRHYRLLLLVGLFVLLSVCALVWRGRPLNPEAFTRSTARVEAWPSRLNELPQRFAAGTSKSDASGVLAEMAKALQAAPHAEAVAALIALLDSGADAATGLLFKIGSRGDLAGAPTLRVWMLDQLGRLDGP